MFDLEQAIAGWRRQMLAAGIQSPVPLEELGIHLRDEIERLAPEIDEDFVRIVRVHRRMIQLEDRA